MMRNPAGIASFSVAEAVYSSRKPLVIAEIGTGHNNERQLGLELVAAALEAGADCVKFQHVYAEEIIHPKTGLVPLPGGAVSLFDRFRELSCGPDFLADMKMAVESGGGLFLCTPFGLRSARELKEMAVGAMKVASPELNHLPLLDELASYRLPTILSSGVSRLADIEQALACFSQGDGMAGLALLHCVTAYPAPETDYNLNLLPLLGQLFGIAVGVSDHSLDPVLVPALALARGACIVEKHICLSRQDTGLDDPIALEPAQFATMTSTLRSLAGLAPAELERTLTETYGREKVEAVLGSGRKELSPSEQANYGRTNRSVHALRDIRAGERFTAENLALLRTEKILRPGLHPHFLPHLYEKKAARDIPDGEGIVWEDIGGPAAD